MSDLLIAEISEILSKLTPADRQSVISHFLNTRENKPSFECEDPGFITGPLCLKARLIFYPIEEEVRRRKKKGDPGSESPIQTKKLYIPSLNDYISAERVPGGYARKEFVRKWLEVGKRTANTYLEVTGQAPLNLKWCHVVIVTHMPDFIKRDVHNIYVKSIFDGLTQAGIWKDDRYVIDVRLTHGGVDKENPRTEMLIYSLELTPEQEISVLGWDNWSREEPEKASLFSWLNPKKKRVMPNRQKVA